MGLEIQVNHPAYPKGVQFGLPGVGVIENGGTLILSDDEVAELEARTGKKASDIFKASKFKVKIKRSSTSSVGGFGRKEGGES